MRITLKFDTPWRIGSWASKSANAVETLVDGLTNKPLIPGSTIAGGLRAAAPQRETAFGPEPGSDAHQVSPWWILGTSVEGATTKPRHRNRIDRERQAAAVNGLFETEEVWGGRLTIYLRGEDVAIEPLLEAVQAWRPTIGAGKSVGMGRAKITGLRYRELDLDDPTTLLEYLQPAQPAQRVENLLRAKAREVQVEAPPETPLIVAKLRCRYLARQDGQACTVHGSQLKGILRSRVEFIARSLEASQPPVAGPESQVKVCGTESEWIGCGECGVCRAFGSTQAAGALEFQAAEVSPDDREPDKRVRIGIDRFTGGARQGAWFVQEYRTDVDLTLVIRDRRPAMLDSWVQTALLHALRDLDDGLVTVGAEGAVGYGRVKVTDLEVAGKPTSLGDLDPVRMVTR